ncbi:hypothetical protein OJAV_G00198200 [Oryzias javanicus]|uniref:Uncharacterized protein n=1 Tax=Oryzias javanicus TaxID=123683 RepID=A0A3S2TYV8_ORYJA|nr:hypothetical protein OJAV_G00198200 [Oryzias javanicus]
MPLLCLITARTTLHIFPRNDMKEDILSDLPSTSRSPTSGVHSVWPLRREQQLPPSVLSDAAALEQRKHFESHKEPEIKD